MKQKNRPYGTGGYRVPITAKVTPDLAAWVKEQAKRLGQPVTLYVEDLLLRAAETQGAFAPGKAEEIGSVGTGESVSVPGLQPPTLDTECSGGCDAVCDRVS